MAIWNDNLRLPAMDPYTEDDFLFEWGDYLADADISAIEVTATNAIVESSVIVNAAQDVACRIKTGAVDTDAVISCKITTNNSPARKEKRSFTVAVKDL